MLQSLNMEVPLRVTGPDGTVLWQGSGILGVVYGAICRVAAITESNALMLDPATTLLQASNMLATGNPLAGAGGALPNVLSAKPTTGAAVQGVLGCALNSAAIGAQVVVAGPGSIALCTTATAGTLGHYAVPAAAGSTTQTAVGVAGPNQNVGRVVKIAGTSGGFTDTGTATRIGIVVSVGGTTS